MTETQTREPNYREQVTKLTSGEADSVPVFIINRDGSREARKLTVHPLAKMIPLITLGDLDRLYDDIVAHGVNEPLVMFEQMVLDGRNRLAVASVLGKPVQLRDFNGTEEDARAFVWSANAARRHLTIPQLALAADRFGFIDQAKREAEKQAPRTGDGKYRSPTAPWALIASKKVGGAVTARTLERFEEAQIKEAPETLARIESGKIRRVDVAVKEAAAERSILLGRTIEVPPPVPRTPWDRLGCARGDVAAAERAILLGQRGMMTRQQFSQRAREIQAALIRIEWLYRENRAG